VTDTKPRPFDERAALEQLEQLAEKIQTTRRQRERAVAEFNAFVKTFKDADHDARVSALQSVPRPHPRSSAPPSPVVVPPAAAVATVERREIEPHVVEIPPSAAVFERPAAPEPEPSSWSAPRQPSLDLSWLWRSPRGRIGIAAAAVVVLALIATWLWRSSDDGGTTAAQPAAAPAAQAAPEGRKPAEPTPVASTGPPVGAQGTPARALNVVLITSRPVWTRVIVDDRKVIEREIAGAETIPLGADRAITIRAGDAGAIKLIVDGKDVGVLGRDGQIASRTLTASATR
jgi:Domain of unknown function (DUF4115)